MVTNLDLRIDVTIFLILNLMVQDALNARLLRPSWARLLAANSGWALALKTLPAILVELVGPLRFESRKGRQ